MAVAPGFSITELVQVLYKCKEIYRTFCSKDDSAAVRLRAFGEELDRVEEELRFDDQIFSWTGQHYPGLKAFDTNLKAYLKFLDNNLSTFNKGYIRNTGGALRTDRLSYDLQEFCSYKLRVLLEHSFRRSEQPDAPAGHDVFQRLASSMCRPAQAFTLPPPDPSTELVLILNQYKRRVNSQADHAGSIESLNNRFWSCYSQICQQNGLPDDFPVAVIPLDDLQKYLDSARQSYALQSSVRTLRSKSDVEVLQSRFCQVDILVGVDDPICAVEYLMLGRTCRFINAQKQTLFEHHLRDRDHCFSHFNVDRKPLTLGFLDGQQITNYPASTPPEYKFYDKGAYEQFQIDIEQKALLLESRIISMKSESLKESTGNAINFCAKLWKSNDNTAEPWLTFPAMFQRRLKLWIVPLRWFNDLAIPVEDSSREITMQLATPPDSPVPAGQRRDSLSRKTRSFSLYPRRSSVSSNKSDTDSLASFTSSQLAGSYAPQGCIEKVGYLKITFETPEGRIAFVESFRQLRQVLRPNHRDTLSTAASSTVGSPYIQASDCSLQTSAPTTTTTSSATSPSLTGHSPALSISRVPVGSRSTAQGPSPRPPRDEHEVWTHMQTLDLRTATGLIPLEAVMDEDEVEHI
ncbi:hypothetical protein LTR86_000076 [Recurvomyces mirabilis]|nr:hypothetical protein LTR86_000076 [Recurvomyces mirabilis]